VRGGVPAVESPRLTITAELLQEEDIKSLRSILEIWIRDRGTGKLLLMRWERFGRRGRKSLAKLGRRSCSAARRGGCYAAFRCRWEPFGQTSKIWGSSTPLGDSRPDGLENLQVGVGSVRREGKRSAVMTPVRAERLIPKPESHINTRNAD